MAKSNEFPEIMKEFKDLRDICESYIQMYEEFFEQADKRGDDLVEVAKDFIVKFDSAVKIKKGAI